MDGNMHAASGSALDALIAPVKRRVQKRDIFAFVATFILMYAEHMYMFTHKFINLDDIGSFLDNPHLLSSGRWLLHLISCIDGDVSSSWLSGLFATLFVAIACVFMIRTLNVRRRISIALCIAAFVSFPFFASMYAYMFCAVPYSFAIAAAAAGAYYISKGRWKDIFLGGVLLACSMGCYQAFFPLAAALLVVALIRNTFNSEYPKFKDFLISGLKYVAGLAIGMILYFVILKILLVTTGTELTAYQGINNMGKVTPAELVARTRMAYFYWYSFYFLGGGCASTFHVFFKYLTALSIILDVVALVVIAGQRDLLKSKTFIIEAVIGLLFFPLACDLIFVMTNGLTHYLMVLPNVLPLMLPAVIAEDIGLDGKKLIKRLCALLTAALILLQCSFIYEFTLVTGKSYFILDMSYRNVYSYYTRLETKIESFEGYTKDTPVALISNAHLDTGIPSLGIVGIGSPNGAADIYDRGLFMYYFTAARFNLVDAPTKAKIGNSAEFKAMPTYPDDGGMKMIDGVLVVKLSEFNSFRNWDDYYYGN